MTPEQLKYTEEMRETFASAGWDWVLTECEEAIQIHTNIDNISTQDQLWFSKGVIYFAMQIKNLQQDVLDLEAEDDE